MTEYSYNLMIILLLIIKTNIEKNFLRRASTNTNTVDTALFSITLGEMSSSWMGSTSSFAHSKMHPGLLRMLRPELVAREAREMVPVEGRLWREVAKRKAKQTSEDDAKRALRAWQADRRDARAAQEEAAAEERAATNRSKAVARNRRREAQRKENAKLREEARVRAKERDAEWAAKVRRVEEIEREEAALFNQEQRKKRRAAQAAQREQRAALKFPALPWNACKRSVPSQME